METTIAILALIILIVFVVKFVLKKKTIERGHQSLDKYIKGLDKQREEVKKSKGNIPPSDGL